MSAERSAAGEAESSQTVGGSIPVRRTSTRPTWPAAANPALWTAGWRGWWRSSPAAQIHHLGEHVVVHVELPRVRPSEVVIDLDPGTARLVIHEDQVTSDPEEVRPPPGRPGPFALWSPCPASSTSPSRPPNCATGSLPWGCRPCYTCPTRGVLPDEPGRRPGGVVIGHAHRLDRPRRSRRLKPRLPRPLCRETTGQRCRVVTPPLGCVD